MADSNIADTFTSDVGEALETLCTYFDTPLKADLAVVDICLVLLGERDCAQVRFSKRPDNEISAENEDILRLFDEFNLFVVGTEHHRYGLDDYTPQVEFSLYRTGEDWHKYQRAKQTTPLATVNAERFGIPSDAADEFVRDRQTDSETENHFSQILADLLDFGAVTESEIRNLMLAQYSTENTEESVRQRVMFAQERGDRLDEVSELGTCPVVETALQRLREFSDPEWYTSSSSGHREYPEAEF